MNFKETTNGSDSVKEFPFPYSLGFFLPDSQEALRDKHFLYVFISFNLLQERFFEQRTHRVYFSLHGTPRSLSFI